MTTGSGPSAIKLIERGAAELSVAGIRDARFESELLLRHALGCSRERLLARWRDPVSAEGAGLFFQLVERRRGRVPIQHLLGNQEFYGLSFRITPAVLIPRPETEGVVDEALTELAGRERPRIVDVGCGSGCIAIALARAIPDAEVFAVDASPAALAVARENAQRHDLGRRIVFLHGDLVEPVRGDAPFDAIVSNPPYIADDEMEELEPEVSEHEPRMALAGGADGLEVIERLIPRTRDVLAPGGVLVLEIAKGQDRRVEEIVERAGLEMQRIASDLAGIPRIVVARKG
ncbi:MAG TPA: peptide chain release factor N(5)-glutamine methyltransferase [Vicinamibacteria bacterium]|nr:peptide chain release factor N(5)-glutamine methyltransferase [Vicinamibacteria bacterium]